MSQADPFGRLASDDSKDIRLGHYTRYANFFERFAALVIDFIVCSILIFAATFAVIAAENGEEPSDQIMLAIFILVPWLYYALLESSPMGATLGKRALGLVVTDKYGDPIDTLKGVYRYASKIIIPLTGGIGYLMILFMPKCQALHDLMAGTLVWKR